MAVSLSVNGKSYSVDVPPQMPLLWVLRDVVGLTGTKFGCGMALCGACTVHVNGVAQRSCILPVNAVKGPVTTIEGLSASGDHPVQKAWIANNVPGRSCRRPRCSRELPARATRTSMRRWAATSAAAGPTRGSAPP